MIMNLTPHRVTVIGQDGEQTHYDPESVPARVTTEVEYIGEVEGHPLYRETLGEVTGLPDAIDGVFLIVSRMVAQACLGSDDLIVPHGLVRDQNGVVIGCAGFVKV